MYAYIDSKHNLQMYRLRVCIITIFFVASLWCFCTATLGNNSPDKIEDRHDALGDRRISLEEAIHLALEKNPELQSARDEIDASLGALRQSRLYPNPVLQFLAEEMPTHEIGLNQSQNLIAVTQPIITGGKRKLGIKVSEQSKERSEFGRDVVLLDVVADTKKAFYKITAGQESLSVAKETEEIAKNIYESERVRFEAGEVPVTNVLRAEVELAKARNVVFSTESDLQNSIKELLTVMGIPGETLEGVTGKLLAKPEELSLHALKSRMVNNQPLLRALKKDIEIAGTQLTLEKRQIIPDIDVSAGYKRLGREEIDTVQLGVAIPVPFLNRNQGNIQRGKALTRKAEHDYQSVYNELLLQLKKNFNTYHAERKRVSEYTDKILPATEDALTLITRGYKEGEFGYIDLLDAQRTRAETRISYIESLKNLNLIIADIEKLTVMKIKEQ